MSSQALNLMGAGLPAQLASAAAGRATATGITAAGTTITDATQLTQGVNIVGTVAASTGVKLPADIEIGGLVVVQNLGANDLEVYPPDASTTINGASAGGAITLAAATDVVFIGWKTSSTTWAAIVAAGPAT